MTHKTLWVYIFCIFKGFSIYKRYAVAKKHDVEQPADPLKYSAKESPKDLSYSYLFAP